METSMKQIGVWAVVGSLAMMASATPFATFAQSKFSGNVVKIGVLTDMSGQFSHESGDGSVTAIKMAVEDFGGKVLGVPIEVIVADHQNKPDVAASKAREWYDTQQVDMIANLINSGVALSVVS